MTLQQQDNIYGVTVTSLNCSSVNISVITAGSKAANIRVVKINDIADMLS